MGGGFFCERDDLISKIIKISVMKPNFGFISQNDSDHWIKHCLWAIL
jgi:hypothetical protein